MNNNKYNNYKLNQVLTTSKNNYHMYKLNLVLRATPTITPTLESLLSE